jgi:nicotinamidase-related amidase
MPRKNSALRSKKRSKRKQKMRRSNKMKSLKSLGRKFGLTVNRNERNYPKQGFVFTPAVEEKGDNCLFIIDPQNSFIDDGISKMNIGSAAANDMVKISTFITGKNTPNQDSIVVTLDTHSRFHIGNANAFEKSHDFDSVDSALVATGLDGSKRNLEPKQGKATPAIKDYITKLGKHGKSHTLWPLHCLMGTSGHNVHKTLDDALTLWSEDKIDNKKKNEKTEVRYILKGCDTLYENFSVFKSAVIDSFSNSHKEAFKFNEDLAKHLCEFKNLYICGEARSHCVKDSAEDYIKWYNTTGKKGQTIYILWDCMSDVEHFEKNSEEFYKFCKEHKGKCTVKVVNSTDITKEI